MSKFRRIAGSLMLEAMIVILLTITCVTIMVKISSGYMSRIYHMHQQMDAKEIEYVERLVKRHGLTSQENEGYIVQVTSDTSGIVTYKSKTYKASWVINKWIVALA